MSPSIRIDPGICHGKPCIAGHRIPVSMVLELLAEGISFEEILREYYSSLTRQDLTECVLYAKHLIEPESPCKNTESLNNRGVRIEPCIYRI